MSTNREPLVDEHGVEHRHGCPLPGWESSRQATAGWWLVNCAGCGRVRMVRAEAAKSTGGGAMSVTDPDLRLMQASRQAKHYRTQLRRAEAYIAQLNAFAVRVLLDGRLADPEDFHAFIGMDKVTTPDGRLDFGELEIQIADLVRRKPHLSARPGRIDSAGSGAPEASDPSTTPPVEDTRTAGGQRASHSQEEA